MKKIFSKIAAPLALMIACAGPAYAIDYEFTDDALKAMAGVEEQRTKLCVSLDSQRLVLSNEISTLSKELQQAQDRGDNLEAERLRVELSTLTSEIGAVEEDLTPCQGLVFFRPVAESFCARTPFVEGSLCDIMINELSGPDEQPLFVSNFDELFAPEATLKWRYVADKALTGPGNAAAEAGVRKGNMQVRFYIRTEGFDATGTSEEDRAAVDEVRQIDASHGINLEDDGFVYAPFLVAEMLDGAGQAGETYQVLVVFEEGGELQAISDPKSVLPGQKVARHGIPLDAVPWEKLPQYAGIGIAGLKREGETEEVLYYIGIENDGLADAMVQLMAYYKGF